MDDFRQPTLGAVIGRKPYLFWRLSELNRRERDLALLGPAAVMRVDLDRQPCDAVAQLHLCAAKVT